MPSRSGRCVQKQEQEQQQAVERVHLVQHLRPMHTHTQPMSSRQPAIARVHA